MREVGMVLVAMGVTLAACSMDAAEQAAAQPAGAPVAAMPELEIRRVWSGVAPNFYAAAPSPDGRFLSEIDWATGDLAVLDLESGELRRVTNKGTWVDNTDYAEFSVFSPDGEWIAYSWFSEEARGYQLRVIDVDGEGMRVLVPAHPEILYVAAEDWSPDSQLVAVTVLRADRSSQIALVSVEDGTMRALKSSDWRQPFVAAFSPDSRYLAYDFPVEQNGGPRDIFLMSVDGGRETRVVSGPADDVLLGWLSDDAILFYSERGLWRQRVQQGRPSGAPELLRADVWHLFPIGFSRDAYYFGVRIEMPQVHTAVVDLEHGRMVSALAPVQEPSAGGSSFGAWSPDSRYLAYLTSQAGRGPVLAVRPVDGADQRFINLDLTQPSNLQWSSDGRSVLLFGGDPKGREGIFRVDVASGAHELVLQRFNTHGDMRRFRITADGRLVLFKRGDEGAAESGLRRPLTVIAHDLETGMERELYASGPGQLSLGPVELSPDGVFFSTKGRNMDAGLDRLLVGRTDGTGELRVIHETRGRFLQNRGGFPWTPDGRHVLAIEHFPGEGRSRLLQIPVHGGEPAILLELESRSTGNQLEQEFVDLRLSPDGRRISLGSGQDRGEFWRIDGLRGAGLSR